MANIHLLTITGSDAASQLSTTRFSRTIQRVRSQFGAFARDANMLLKPYSVEIPPTNAGDSPRQIAQAIAAISPEREDVAILYYAGHGHNQGTAGSPSKYPSIDLPGVNDPHQSPNLESLANDLHGKGAALTIAIADTCSTFDKSDRKFELAAAQRPRPARLRCLFTQYRGLIKMASAEAGQHAFFDGNGGIFTGHLLSAIGSGQDQQPEQYWANAINRATVQIEGMNDLGGVEIQQPFGNPQITYTDPSGVPSV